MEGTTAVASPVDLDRRSAPTSSPQQQQQQQGSRVQSTNTRSKTNSSSSVRVSSNAERHTLPEIPRNPLTATVAHVVSRELG